MSRKTFPVILLIGISMLSCNLLTAVNPASGTSNQAAPTASNSPSQPSSSGACSNALYPVKQGVMRAYAISGLSTGPAAYTETITDVQADSFTITTQFGNLTKNAKWDCKPDGLVELQPGGGAAMLNTSSGMQADFNVTKSSGVTLPTKISAGDAWTYSLDFTSQITLNNSSGQAQGTASYQLKAMGNESVTVPAGTFNAMKLQINTTFNMQMALSGMNVPITLTETTTAWYAPNVGMVKQLENANMMGETINATTELQSYKIP